MVVAVPIPDQTAMTLAETVAKELISVHGAPRILVTDQGKQYESELFTETMQLFGIDHIFSSAYHHQSNGVVERYNRTLGNGISVYSHSDPGKWDEYVPWIVAAYNGSRHSTTGYSPNFLVYGRELALPTDRHLQLERTEQRRSLPDYVQHLQAAVKCSRAITSTLLEQAAERNKRYYDNHHHVKSKSMDAGDLVMLHFPQAQVGQSSKLHQAWREPYRIIERTGPNCTVKHTDSGKEERVHINRLKRFKEQSRPDDNGGEAEVPDDALAQQPTTTPKAKGESSPEQPEKPSQEKPRYNGKKRKPKKTTTSTETKTTTTTTPEDGLRRSTREKKPNIRLSPI